MTSYTEEQLIFPSLKIINRSKYGIRTSELIKVLRDDLRPDGDDLKILINRNDDKFSQKVRNLRSHKTLEKLGFAILSNEGKYRITSFGKRKLFEYEHKHQPNLKKTISSETTVLKNKEDLLNKRIFDLELGERVTNICDSLNITFLYELVVFIDQNDQIKGLGSISRAQINKFLHDNDLTLNDAINTRHYNLNIEEDDEDNLNLDKYLPLFHQIETLNLNFKIKKISKRNNLIMLFEIITNIESLMYEKSFGKKSRDELKLFLSSYDLSFTQVKQIATKYDLYDYYSNNKSLITDRLHRELKGTNSDFIDEYINLELLQFINSTYGKAGRDIFESRKNRMISVINHRYGINDKKYLTLEEIAIDYNITRERVRQIERTFRNHLLKRKVIQKLVEDLYEEFTKIKFIRTDHINSVVKGIYFKNNVDGTAILSFINDFIKKKLLSERIYLDYNKINYIFLNKKIYNGIYNALKYIRRASDDQNVDIKIPVKKISVLEEKFGQYFDSRRKITKQLSHIEHVVFDEEEDSIALYKEKNWITLTIKKLKFIINDKIEIEELLTQINRNHRFRGYFSSTKLLKKYIKLSGYRFDDQYLYFDSVNNSDSYLTEIEQKAIQLVEDNNYLFIFEKIYEIRYDYEIFTSSVAVYLRNNPLFKEIAKNVITLAGRNYSKFEMLDAVTARKNYLKTFRQTMYPSWDNNIFKINLKLDPANLATNKIYLPKSISGLIEGNEFKFSKKNNYNARIHNGVFWVEKQKQSTDKSFFDYLQLKAGDELSLNFDLENGFFNINY